MAPEAFFDCLQIAGELTTSLDGLTKLDIQRIAYLSCLLSIYQARPVAEWGYRFANTDAGAPFSDQISEAVQHQVARGHLATTGNRLSITESGKQILDILRKLDSNMTRIPCLNAACASMLAVPLGTIASGIDNEPTVAASQLRTAATLLLEEPHLQMLHEHFGVLSQVIPPSDGDLFSPSVLWLSCLSNQAVSVREYESNVDEAIQ